MLQARFRISPAMAVCCALALGAGSARADGPGDKTGDGGAATPEQGRKAIDRGLGFLKADAAKWREERSCATCHHGIMTTWALSEAKSQGYPVAADTLADMAEWTRQRLAGIDKPRDKRPGWNVVNTGALYLALMAEAVPGQQAISRADLERVAGHLLRHQEQDGSWDWSGAPIQNLPPPVFESDEVATLMAYIALGPRVPAGPGEKSPRASAGRRRPPGWRRPGPPRVPRRRPSACSATSGRASPRRSSSRGSLAC